MYNENMKIKMKKETIWKVIVVVSSILLVFTSIAPLFFLR